MRGTPIVCCLPRGTLLRCIATTRLLGAEAVTVCADPSTDPLPDANDEPAGSLTGVPWAWRLSPRAEARDLDGHEDR